MRQIKKIAEAFIKNASAIFYITLIIKELRQPYVTLKVVLKKLCHF